MSKSKLLELEQQATATRPPQSLPAFVPPLCVPGTPVYWYDDRHKTTRQLGICLHQHQGGLIDVAVLIPNEFALRPWNGVRHADDPNKEAIDGAGEGCWEHTEQTKALAEHLGMIDLLMDTVDQLKADQIKMLDAIAALSKRGKKDAEGN